MEKIIFKHAYFICVYIQIHTITREQKFVESLFWCHNICILDFFLAFELLEKKIQKKKIRKKIDSLHGALVNELKIARKGCKNSTWKYFVLPRVEKTLIEVVLCLIQIKINMYIIYIRNINLFVKVWFWRFDLYYQSFN